MNEKPTPDTDEMLIALRQKNAELLALIVWAYETLYEINPSNYDHDEVCRLNDRSVEVILGLKPHLPTPQSPGRLNR